MTSVAEPRRPRPTWPIHAIAIAMAAWMVAWVALPGPTDGVMIIVALCNPLPLAVWWPWALCAARAGHTVRGPVVGTLLAFPVILAYPQLDGVATSDAQGGLVYVSLPVALLVGTTVAVGLAEVVGRLTAHLGETSPPQSPTPRSSPTRCR